MRIIDLSSDVCSSDLPHRGRAWAPSSRSTESPTPASSSPRRWGGKLPLFEAGVVPLHLPARAAEGVPFLHIRLMFGQRIGEDVSAGTVRHEIERLGRLRVQHGGNGFAAGVGHRPLRTAGPRSEENTSELQSLMRTSYAD